MAPNSSGGSSVVGQKSPLIEIFESLRKDIDQGKNDFKKFEESMTKDCQKRNKDFAADLKAKSSTGKQRKHYTVSIDFVIKELLVVSAKVQNKSTRILKLY